MEKTISSILLLMIITGTIFTACGPKVEDPDAAKSLDEGQVKENDGSDVDEAVVEPTEGEEAVAGENDDKVVDGEDKDGAKEHENGDVKVDEPKIQDEKPVDSAPAPVQQPPAPPVVDPEPTVVAPETVYKNGTYSQTAAYQSPAGPESVGVSLTVENDVVVSVKVDPNATNTTSQQFQKLFADGISGQMVGKKLDQIGGFTQVNGASLTAGGFNKALAVIKADAKN